MRKLNIDQKINFRQAELVLHHILTRPPALRKILPRFCKTRAVYNTCYDFGRNYAPVELVNDILSKSSDRVKEYIINNLPKYKYLKVELVAGSWPHRFKHSFVDEKPRNYRDLERTSFVKYMEVGEVTLKGSL